jgi:hypothetical protein
MPSNGSKNNKEKQLTEKKPNQSLKLPCVVIVELDAFFACSTYLFNKTDRYGQAE